MVVKISEHECREIRKRKNRKALRVLVDASQPSRVTAGRSGNSKPTVRHYGYPILAMIADKEHRARIAYLRHLAVDSLKNYSGGFAALHRIDRDLKGIIAYLEDIADPAWASSLRQRWIGLEIIYAVRLADGRHSLTAEEEADVQDIVAGLLQELQGYQIALTPEDKPEEGDTVRLRRSLPEHGLRAGARGTIIVDYAEYTDSDEPLDYGVEFTGPDGTTDLFENLSVHDVELVSRPSYEATLREISRPASDPESRP